MVKDQETVERMRRTGRLAADILVELAAAVEPGVTTDSIDALCHRLALDAGAYPSPLGYGPRDNPFPKSLCTSVNEVICHGIPDSRELEAGDIVSLDVTVYREGVHGDTCATVCVGEAEPRAQELVSTTARCLADAISGVRPGQRVNEIGRRIEDRAETNNFGVVRDFIGHGIGPEFHGRLQIPHYFDRRATLKLESGMTFTIEPMITSGDFEVRMWPDGWTAVTADQSWCAQFEHSLVVTDDGVEILTTPTSTSAHPYWAALASAQLTQ